MVHWLYGMEDGNMCLENERKVKDRKNIVGYCVMNTTDTKNVYESVFCDGHMLGIKERKYKKGIRYKARRESVYYRKMYWDDKIVIPGFHGFRTKKDVCLYIDKLGTIGRRVLKCEFDGVIASGKAEATIPAFRAMYRTILEEVEV